MFGGSAMWGWGAPDWGTIPAYLQTELERAGDRPVCVVNYAENGFVSTQNVIQLSLLLAAGDVPDVVVFYDGVNDVLAARQTGQPVLHQNLTQIATRFGAPQQPLLAWVRTLNTFRLVESFVVHAPARMTPVVGVGEGQSIGDGESIGCFCGRRVSRKHDICERSGSRLWV